MNQLAPDSQSFAQKSRASYVPDVVFPTAVNAGRKEGTLSPSLSLARRMMVAISVALIAPERMDAGGGGHPCWLEVE